MQTEVKKHGKGFLVLMILIAIVGMFLLEFIALVGGAIMSPKTEQAIIKPASKPAAAQPTIQSKQVTIVQPHLLGKESDFTAKYGSPVAIATQAQLKKSGMNKYSDRAVWYKVGDGELMAASKSGVVNAILGDSSLDYKQFFPTYVTGAPYQTKDNMDMYYVTPSNATGTIGEIGVDHSGEPWTMLFLAYPA